MAKKEKLDIDLPVCECCGQSTHYALKITRGTAIILKAFSVAIRRKGINMIHPTKEMEVLRSEWNYERAVSEGVLTSTQIGNMSTAGRHGLIVKSKENTGNWVLTSKGSAFLHGDPIPRIALISKSAKGKGMGSHKDEYYMPEDHQCTIHDFTKKDPMWEGINYEIVEGHIVPFKPIEGQYKE